MTKYSGPEDVYQELVDDSKEHWLLGLLAFAIVEQQRIDWVRHRRETVGQSPSELEIQAWYESQPSSVLVRARGEAESALKIYSEEVVEEFDEAYRKEIGQGIVVGEIQKLGRWMPQLGMNIVGSLIGSVVFAAILIVLALFIFREPSTRDMADKIGATMEAQDEQVGTDK